MSIMSESKVKKSYYIGDPKSEHERGQDTHGMVHCLVWGIIYEKGAFFAATDKYAVGIGGGGIGDASTISEARAMIHDYAHKSLAQKKAEAEDLIRRIDSALCALGDDPANIEQFFDDYKPSTR